MSYMIEYYWQSPIPNATNSGWYPIVSYGKLADANEKFANVKEAPSLYKYRLRNTETDKVRQEFEHPELIKAREEAAKPKKKRKYTKRAKKE